MNFIKANWVHMVLGALAGALGAYALVPGGTVPTQSEDIQIALAAVAGSGLLSFPNGTQVLNAVRMIAQEKTASTPPVSTGK